MNTLSTFLALMATLSMATERITEAIKGFPGLSLLLAKQTSGLWDEARKAAIHIIAIGVGTGLAYSAQGAILAALGLQKPTEHTWALPLLLGGLASGGSGIWNSTLDIVRTINQQRQAVAQGLAPRVSGIAPGHAAPGTTVVITGSGFGATRGSIAFNGTPATAIANWTDTSITVTVPAGATTGNVIVTTAAGVDSAGTSFTIP
jgi:hypothetical protein